MDLLIEELTPTESHLITESTPDGKDTYLSGIFMQAELKNRNGRVYPIAEIAKAVEGAKTVIAEQGGIFGELDHPQTLTINLDRISHAITDIRMEGNNAIGRAKLLGTPMGSIAQELVKSGVRLGVSSRGAGAVNESTVADFNFVTVDIVATPSAPGAMPNAVYESLELSKSGRQVLTLAQQLKEDPDAQEYLKRAVKKFLNENLFAKK